MGYVKSKDKRTGITYVYESESYWDKEKQQSRARRKLIGKIDEATGNIVPTDGRGRHRKDKNAEKTDNTTRGNDEVSRLTEEIKQLKLSVSALTAENAKLQKEKDDLLSSLQEIIHTYKE